MTNSDAQALRELQGKTIGIAAQSTDESMRRRLLTRAVVKIIAAVVFVGATLLPIFKMIQFLATTGANTLSSDDLLFVTPLLDQVLNGTYRWQNFLHDTFFNTHQIAIGGMVFIFFAWLTHLNIYYILFLHVVLVGIRVVLIHDALTRVEGHPIPRLLLWPFISALAFSASQLSYFEHAATAMAVGAGQFGFAVGVWGLARFPGRWRGVWIMLAGGIFASLSFGSGLITWPVFFLGLIMLGYRRRLFYLAWFSGMLLAALPYITSILSNTKSADFQQTALQSPLKLPLIFALLGLSFAPNMSTVWAGFSGMGAVLLCSVGGILLWRVAQKSFFYQVASAVMLLAYGAGGAWQVSIFRDIPSPWYSYLGTFFWTGLLGLACILWIHRNNDYAHNRLRVLGHRLPLVQVWCVITVGIMTLLYLATNQTYADKSAFLQTRSPASASCLRHYLTAPPHCEATLFIWPTYHVWHMPEIVRVLQQYQLSVFAPRQEWTLQGDFILDSVGVAPSSGERGPYWSADRGNTVAPWSDFRHLDLAVPNSSAISWTVSLPSGLQRAKFYSAIDLGSTTEKIAEPVTFVISVAENGKPERVIFSQTRSSEQQGWQPLSILLDPYIGQTITLRLTAQAESAGQLTLFRFPYIDAQFAPSSATTSDFVKSNSLPTPTTADLNLDIASDSDPRSYNMEPVKATNDTWYIDEKQLLPKPPPSLKYTRPLNACLDDYSHLSIKVAAQEELYPRTIEVRYQLDHAEVVHSIILPLRKDSELHHYTYDLKLLQLPDGAHLTGIQLAILGRPYRAVPDGRYAVQLSDLRFIRNDQETDCSR